MGAFATSDMINDATTDSNCVCYKRAVSFLMDYVSLTMAEWWVVRCRMHRACLLCCVTDCGGVFCCLSEDHIRQNIWATFEQFTVNNGAMCSLDVDHGLSVVSC